MARNTRAVTVIGLGLMGSALARAFRKAGHDLTVWNRSASKTVPFQGSARIAGTITSAVAASGTVIVSLPNYEIANGLLRTTDVEGVIAGKALAQRTRGTPHDARDSEAWSRLHNATYLDGAIAGYPRTIGTDANEIFYSGDATVFEAQRDAL